MTEPELKIKRRFRLQEQLGAGAFGEIYSGVDMQNGQPVAIKLEPVDAEHPQLAYEARVYNQLNVALFDARSDVGVPRMLYNGVEGQFNVLVMERKGSNLENLFNQCGRRFTLRTVLLLADQMLHVVSKVHAQRLVHRDIKPDNFVVGVSPEEKGKLFLIDFGLSKCYWNPSQNKHIPFRDDKHLTGTGRYASIGNHKGFEQSRRDDLEAIGYVLIYFLKGGLPWQSQKDKSRRTRYQKMLEGKLAAIQSESLWRGLPDAFRQFFRYVLNLEFEETPDYAYLRRLFTGALAHTEGGGKKRFDWEE